MPRWNSKTASPLARRFSTDFDTDDLGSPSGYTCPDCNGSLHRSAKGNFRCHVGHAWTADALLAARDGEVEGALWVALRSLQEKAKLSRRLADQSRARRSCATLSGDRRRDRTCACRVLGDRFSELTTPNMRSPVARPVSPLAVVRGTAATLPLLTVEGVLDSHTYRTLRDAVIKAALGRTAAVIVDVNGLDGADRPRHGRCSPAHAGTSAPGPMCRSCWCAGSPHAGGRSPRTGVTRYVPVHANP